MRARFLRTMSRQQIGGLERDIEGNAIILASKELGTANPNAPLAPVAHDGVKRLAHCHLLPTVNGDGLDRFSLIAGEVLTMSHRGCRNAHGCAAGLMHATSILPVPRTCRPMPKFVSICSTLARTSEYTSTLAS
jgi:hypothetical protein